MGTKVLAVVQCRTNAQEMLCEPSLRVNVACMYLLAAKWHKLSRTVLIEVKSEGNGGIETCGYSDKKKC